MGFFCKPVGPLTPTPQLRIIRQHINVLGVYGSRCARSANTRCARSAGLNIKSLTKWGIFEVFSDYVKRESNGKMTN